MLSLIIFLPHLSLVLNLCCVGDNLAVERGAELVDGGQPELVDGGGLEAGGVALLGPTLVHRHKMPDLQR